MSKTHEEKFLDWCSEHGVRWRKIGKIKHSYELNFDHKAVLVVQGVTLKLNREQRCDSICVYFDKDGTWYGGTNMIWNTGLPWER